MRREKILVIDDEEMILQLSKDILENERYEVKTKSNGNEGLKLLEKEKFDLLLTDIKMPDIGGIDVIKFVRTNNKEIPIIVITAHGTLDIAIDALRLGAQGFLFKPFTPAELRSSVFDVLEKTRLLRENIRMRTLMPLFEVSKEIISEIDPRKLLKLILDIAVKETRADKAYIFLIDEATGKVGMKEEHGLPPDFIVNAKDDYGERIVKLILKEKGPLHVSPEVGAACRFRGTGQDRECVVRHLYASYYPGKYCRRSLYQQNERQSSVLSFGSRTRFRSERPGCGCDRKCAPLRETRAVLSLHDSHSVGCRRSEGLVYRQAHEGHRGILR